MDTKLNFSLTVLKDIQEIEINFNGENYIASGNTKANRDTLKACYFVWNNRKEQWIFDPWQSSNNPTNEWNRKKLRQKYGF